LQDVGVRMTLVGECGPFSDFRRGKSDTPFPDSWSPETEAFSATQGPRGAVQIVCPEGRGCGWLTRNGHWARSPLSLVANALTTIATHV
jgi:hypothetical protein